MKRNLILLLAVLMLVFAPTMLLRAEAATIVDSGTCGENVTWTLDSDGLLTISGTGDMTDYNWSDDAPWYSQRESILSITVEDGVTSIGNWAFPGYDNLSSIMIPASVTSIGGVAIRYDTRPITIHYAGTEAQRADISDGGYNSLAMATWHYECNGANCSDPETPSTEPAATESENVVSQSCGENLTWTLDSEGLLTISGTGDMTDYSYYSNTPWDSQRESIRSVVLEEGVTSIGDYAFYGCDSLCSITIPDSVTSIGDSAFSVCSYLSSITIPDSVTIIGSYAFYGCGSLKSITIPDSVTSIGAWAFANCDSLSSIMLPENLTTIDAYVFGWCTSLTNITIPDGVTSISLQAFFECYSLSSITLPAGVTSIGWMAFDGCVSLRTVQYAGTEAQRADIVIEDDNGALTDATWHYGCSGANCIEQKSPFGDVAADAYYFAPVLWAVNKGITNGLSADTFGPEATCTRGQIVTFLWRACGSPEPKMVFNPFSDVSSEDYFYDAVLWAVENGITGGMGDGTFAPGAPCTRGQVATFLWRAEGQPYSYGENIFSDISYGAYYYDAVLWAVEEGITNGMGEGIFAPDATCTRGQIVTFLYRAMN